MSSEKKIAFLFPGQGSQYAGMGKEFYESYQVVKDVFACASDASGLDVAKLCFEEDPRLNQTEYTQIAMVTVEAALAEVLKREGIAPAVTAGLSLGEYGAILTAGVMSQEDIFRVVRKRGLYMQEAYPQGGAMAAVLGGETALVEQICAQAPGIVVVANYNCPGQLVISGEEAGVTWACAQLKEQGVKRCVPLKVSGPFHSPLLSKAGERLSEVLDGTVCNKPVIPYIANVTAQYVTEAEPVKSLLCSQVSSSVRWQQSVELMLADGIDTFVEIGPGKTLSGFMKRINKEAKICSLDRLQDLEGVVKQLQEA